MKETTTRTDANRDPITDAAGSHPVGTGVGALAGGALAGAAAGTVAGPVGTVVGAAVGAVAGGLAGKGIAEPIDPTARGRLLARQLHQPSLCRAGLELRRLRPGLCLRRELLQHLRRSRLGRCRARAVRSLEHHARQSSLDWDRAKHATRDAWNRVSDAVERAVPGDSDRDGK